MKQTHLRTRLMAIMLLLVVVIMLFVGATLFVTISNNYNVDFYEDMARVRENVDFFDFKDSAGLIDYLGRQEALNPQLTDRNFYLLRGDTIIYGNAGGGIIEKTDNLRRVLSGGAHQNGHPFIAVLDYAWTYPTGHTIYILDHRTEMISAVQDYISIFLQTLAIGIGLAVVLSFLFARGFLIPIQKLTKSARLMRQGEFSMVETRSRDEIGTLTAVFNEMGLRITKNIEMLKDLLRNIPKPVFAVNSRGELFHRNEAFEALFEGKEPELSLFLNKKEPRFMLHLQERYYLVYRSLFLLEDGTEGRLFLLDDVTEAELLEQERKQFVADVSHEMKTPLTVIKSYSETLLEQEADAETVRKFLQVINRSADQMDATVSQLIKLIKTETGPVQKEPMELVVAAREILEAMNLQFKQKKLKVRLDAPEARTLTCDNERVRRVMINLLSNSIKYSNPGGKVTVTIAEAEGGVTFAVADEGIGIEKKHLPHLFEKFYRVDKARSRETGGTGLGLSIVHSIVTEMGGTVSVESTFGKGSTFTCFFPD